MSHDLISSYKKHVSSLLSMNLPDINWQHLGAPCLTFVFWGASFGALATLGLHFSVSGVWNVCTVKMNAEA